MAEDWNACRNNLEANGVHAEYLLQQHRMRVKVRGTVYDLPLEGETYSSIMDKVGSLVKS